MILPTDIHTLDSFRKRSTEHLARLRSTGRPEVLTVDGKPSVVVQDAAAYQQQAEKLEVLSALAESVAQAEAGDTIDAFKYLEQLRTELKHR